MLALFLLILGIASRLVIHVPNFTPVLALALFGGVYLSPRRAVVMPLALMMISDLLIGGHNTIFFTWGSVALISLLGLVIRSRKNFYNIAAMAVLSAILFFVVTNIGAWLMMYPKTVAGLQMCFLAAVPFFRDTLVSTLVYSFVLFGGYEMLAQRVAKTRWASILQAV
ncbi:MAG: hypothetical protein H6753_03900 [Candidatus Omnitrophica bacterium]|nr:hypothetical protein [Candidatus Omnitrophota bacterium]